MLVFGHAQPAGHALHTLSPSPENDPGRHTKLRERSEGTGQANPAGHSEHSVDPAVLWKPRLQRRGGPYSNHTAM